MKLKMIWGLRASPCCPKSSWLVGRKVLCRNVEGIVSRWVAERNERNAAERTTHNSVAARLFNPPSKVTPALVQVPKVAVEVETTAVLPVTLETKPGREKGQRAKDKTQRSESSSSPSSSSSNSSDNRSSDGDRGGSGNGRSGWKRKRKRKRKTKNEGSNPGRRTRIRNKKEEVHSPAAAAVTVTVTCAGQTATSVAAGLKEGKRDDASEILVSTSI